MAREISVVIPSRNELKNLLWTLQGLQIALDGIDCEIIVVLNQCDPSEKAALDKMWLARAGILRVVEYNEKPSCWQARNAGASLAGGDYLLFLDSHVLPKCDAFSGALKYHRSFKGMLHFAVNYWLEKPERTLYQYKWNAQRFWGTWSRRRPNPPDFRILMSSICAGMVDRDIFHSVGGFHPALGIYGGGEPYIDLKLQMFGYEVKCHPGFEIYHLTERRGYAWNNDDFRRNFMIAAYALGGDAALRLLYEHYWRRCSGVSKYEDRLMELRDEAIRLAREDRCWTKEHASHTLPQILDGHI